MEKSRQYALSRLDSWYLLRFENNFDRDIFYKFWASIQDHITQKKLSMETKNELKSTLSYKRQKEIAQANFSEGYNCFEEYFESEEGTCANNQRYIKKMLKASESLQFFVEHVRETLDSKFPDELSIKDMDNSFIEIFKDWQGYSIFKKEQIRSVEGLYEAYLTMGHIDEKKYNDLVETLSILQDFSIIHSRVMFEDINY